MKYTIKLAAPTGSFTTKAGKTMNKYMCTFVDETGKEEMAEFSVFEGQPVPSGEVEGDIEMTNYGPRFNKARGGGGGNWGKGESPEKQASIERQNALTNAIQYCTTKANILLANKEYAKAMEEMQGQHILQVATYFGQFNNGKVIVSMTAEEVAAQFGHKPATPPPAPTTPVSDEINLDELNI